MPSIKYKKKTYAGATFPVLEMTKAEYDALPEAKKMDGTVYMITDDTGGWEAENASYDNAESGLTATNVQDALDEISSAGGVSYDNTTSGLTATNVQDAVDELKLNSFVCDVENFTNISVGANDSVARTITQKSGYTLASVYLALSGTGSGHNGTIKMYTQYGFFVSNLSSSAVSNWSVNAYCIWKKN